MLQPAVPETQQMHENGHMLKDKVSLTLFGCARASTVCQADDAISTVLGCAFQGT